MARPAGPSRATGLAPPGTPPLRRWISPWDALPYLVLLAASAWVLLADVHLSLTAGVNDDAGYYFRIARNAVLGHRSTFDGIHPTNGFNPLLEFFCVQAFRLLGADQVLRCYRVGVAITWIFAGLAFWLFAHVVRRGLEPIPSGARRRMLSHGLCAFFFAWILLKEYYGLDTFPALFFQLLLLAVAASRWWRPAAFHSAVLGSIALAACLSRLDCLSFTGAFGLYFVALAYRGRVPWRVPAAFVLPVAVGIGALVWANLHQFGVPLPVSGMLKNSFPHPDLRTAARTICKTSSGPINSIAFYAALGLGMTICTIALHRAWAEWRGRPRRGAALAARGPSPECTPSARSTRGWAAWLQPLSLYAVLHTTFYSLFCHFDFQGAYILFLSVYLLLCLALLAVRLEASGRARWRVASRALGAALLVSAAGLTAVRVTWVAWQYSRALPDEWSLGQELESMTRPGDVLFGEHYGLVGLFTDRVFINGDGVVNTADYLRIQPLRGADLAAYFDREGVTHVFGNPDQRGFRADAKAPVVVRSWPNSAIGRLQLAQRRIPAP